MYNGSAEKVLQYKKFENHKNPNLSDTPSSDWGNQAHYLGLSQPNLHIHIFVLLCTKY